MKNSFLILSVHIVFTFYSTVISAQPTEAVHPSNGKKITVLNARVKVILPKSFKRKGSDLAVLKSDYPDLNLISCERLEDKKGCSVEFFESSLDYMRGDYGMTTWKYIHKITDHFNMIKSVESGYKKINRVDVYYMDFIFSDDSNKLYYAMVASQALYSKYMFSLLVVPALEYKSWRKINPELLNSIALVD